MRVLHWYPNFSGGGGVANAVRLLAEAQARVGLETSIASATAADPGLYGVRGARSDVGLFEWRPAWTLRRGRIALRGISRLAARRLRALRPDVVHVHGEFNPDNWWAPRLFDVPVVLSPHGAFHPAVLARHNGPATFLYLRLGRALLYRHVRAFHAVSPMEAGHLATVFPSRRVDCVPQGPSIRLNLANQRAPRGPGDPVCCLFVGRMDVKAKGLDLLVDACATARSKLTGGSLSLTLIGPDWNGGHGILTKRVRELGVSEQITFRGAVSSVELERLLPEFDFYVQLSRHDAFGFGVADALAVGKPVVMTHTMGIASFQELASLPHVRVVNPSAEEAADAIVEVAERIEELADTATTLRPRVLDLLSWERIAVAHRANYEELLYSSA